MQSSKTGRRKKPLKRGIALACVIAVIALLEEQGTVSCLYKRLAGETCIILPN